MRKQHLAILSDNKPGVLTHIAGLISRKAINIESLTVGYTEEPDVSRFNIVISIEDDKELKQTISQLAKLIDVIKIINLDEAPFISYELAMIKVKSPTPQTREELTNIGEPGQSVPRQSRRRKLEFTHPPRHGTRRPRQCPHQGIVTI